MSASTPLLPSVAKELPDTARDAYAAATEDVQTRLTRRLPPLVLTLCIEMGNAAIIMSYSGELLRYPLLVGFIPVISALGGNIGLQSSSITTRALSHGLASADEATATIRHEMSAVVFLSAALSAMLFAIAATWRSIPAGKSKLHGSSVLNHRVVLHAIDATPARWRGDAGSSPLDRAPDALVDFHTGGHGPVQQTRELREPAARGVPDQQHGAVHLS